MTEPFKLQRVSTPEWIDRIAHFRFDVWQARGMIDTSYFPEQKCLEPIDQQAVHFAVEWEDELVAAARISRHDDIHSTHHGDYYRKAGIDLEGPVAIPEHTVVRPDMDGKGLHKLITAENIRVAKEFGVRYSVVECTPIAAALIKKMGRPSLGRAPDDPRFPGIEFEWILAEYPVPSSNS